MSISLDPPGRKSIIISWKWLLTCLTTIITFFIIFSIYNFQFLIKDISKPYNIPKLRPNGSRSFELFTSLEYRKKSIRYLAGAVQIPTEVFDDSIAPEKDLTQWFHFIKFHEYLETTFPLIFNSLKVEKVNNLGLIITFEGSNSKLKPLIFTGHQDVVPVDNDTLDLWEHGDPFSGYYDGKYMYGRGTSDTKSLVIAHFEVWQLLLEQGYKPKRTMILSLGYDEETIGRYNGALSLVSVLKNRYPEGIYAVIDEGSGIIKLPMEDSNANRFLAIPGTVEKGYIDVFFELSVKGGHSSSPYDHSGIGILSELVRNIESDPFEYTLTDENPILDYLQYLGEVEGLMIQDENLEKLKWAFRNARINKKAKILTLDYLSKHPSLRNLVRTTQAIDIFHAGLKINMIPEYLKLGINHRLSLDLTTDDILKRLIIKAQKIATQFDLNLYLNNGTVIQENPIGKSHLNISWEQPLNSSPISPSNDKVWSVLSGSIKSTFEDVLLPINSTVDVVPFLIGGYTDSSRYYELGDNIYRFTGHTKQFKNMHAINEMIEFDGHLETLGFFYDYILSVNEFDS